MARSRKNPQVPDNNSYFAYILIMLTVIYAVMLKGLKKLEKAALGKARAGLTDRVNLVKKLTQKALDRPNGTAVARLGPPIPYLHSNLAVIVPKITEQMTNLVKTIESQKKGRKILNALEDMVSHENLANMTIEEGAKKQRNLLTAFTSDVKGFMALGRKMFTDALLQWSQKENIVLLDEVKYLVRALTAKRILGADLSKEDNNILERALRAVKSRTTSISPVESAEFVQARDNYRLFSKKLVQETSEHIIEGVKNESKKHNFLSNIIMDLEKNSEHPDKIEEYLNHPKVTSAVLVIATADGIYTNLTSILLHLLTHPEVLEKLRAECLAASEDGKTVSDEKLKNPKALPYLHNVYLEALRVNSSLPILARYTVDGVHTEETDIPAHSNILINLKTMHYDKKRWGEDADEFIPERFNRDGIRDYKLGHAPFIPFSLGRRECPGQKVGEDMIKLFLSEFVLNYTMTAMPNQDPPIVVEESLAPDPGPDFQVKVEALPEQANEFRMKM